MSGRFDSIGKCIHVACNRQAIVNDRFTTDFLCPPSSFLTGMGSVLTVGGGTFEYNTSEDPDSTAIAQDWKMVGQDIDDVLKKAKDAPSANRSK